MAEDPDPATRAEIEELLANRDEAGLAERFGSRLEFGTAGIRGLLGAGPNRMNRVLVRRAAAGLAGYLRQQGLTSSGVVIGYDARHQSDQFAADTASVLAGAGIDARLLPGRLPTPLLAYAVAHLAADAGVMVTASHNPAAYNGYKVYLGDGAQIVPPADAEISAAIDVVGPLSNVALASPDDPRITTVDDALVEQYLVDAAAQSLAPAARDVHVVYTPMHGVGGSVTQRLLAQAGFGRVDVVDAQAEPDPNFPTLPFPNPEEPGALDLAIALATKHRADVVLANDPDADRLGVAVPSHDGLGWQRLSGDEIGVLLADHVLRHTKGDDRLVVTTIVSSSLLARMAAAAGIGFAQCLTGFKWIVRAADSRPDLRFVFGYEEALGYCAGTMVRDKDGITAALLFAELVAELRSADHSVHDRLDQLAVEHGAHVTGQWSVWLDGPDGPGQIGNVMHSLRSARPAHLDGRPVTEVVDLLAGGELPPTDAIILRLGDGSRVMLRPSGTEPKLKVYFEAVEPVIDNRRCLGPNPGGRPSRPAAGGGSNRDRLGRSRRLSCRDGSGAGAGHRPAAAGTRCRNAIADPGPGQRGVEVRLCPWDEAADWASARLVVVRSPWGYFEHRAEFIAWAWSVEATTALFNPAAVLEWNSHKRYLLDLAVAGIPVVATVMVDRGAGPDVQGRALGRHHGEVVIKPAVSAGAMGALRSATGSPEAMDHLARLSRAGDVLVQPLVPTVLAEGETSLVYFGGEFSHAVRKVPANGEYRVHRHYGGRVEPHTASSGEREVAAAALAQAPTTATLAYARVDLVRLDSGPAVMELEVIEPELFLPHHRHAADRFADHLVALMRLSP